MKKASVKQRAGRIGSIRCSLLAGYMLVISLILPGCWDRIEINDIAIVIATAIDKEGDKYRVSSLLPLPGQMGSTGGGGGGTGGTESFYIDSATGYTIRDAVNQMQRRMSRQSFSAHRRVLIISEELARAGITDLMDFVSRTYHSRLSTSLIVAKGTAQELLEADPKFERFSGEAIRELGNSMGVISTSIKQLARAMNSEGTDAIALYMGTVPLQSSEEPSTEIQVLGYAQFRGDKMVDTFHIDTDYGLNWLRKQHEVLTITFPWLDKHITLRLDLSRTRIRPVIKEDSLEFVIDGHAFGYLLEDLTDIDLRQQDQLEKLNERLSQEIEHSIRRCIDKIQRNQADSAGFGALVFRTYPRLWVEKYKPDWDRYLQQAQFTIRIQSSIKRVGLTTDNISTTGDGS